MAWSNIHPMNIVDNDIVKTPVKVYDCDKKALIKSFDCVSDAAKYCGVSTQTLCEIRRTKGRNRKNKLGLTITFR